MTTEFIINEERINMTDGAIDFPESLDSCGKSMWGLMHTLVEIADSQTVEPEKLAHRLYEEQCARDVLTHYTYYYDANDIDRLMNLYEDDCRLVNPRGTYIGKAAIRENYEFLMGQRYLRFHGANNILSRMDDSSTKAWVVAYLYCVSGSSNGWRGMAGTYQLNLRKLGARWLIHEQRITQNILTAGGSLRPRMELPPIPTSRETSGDWAGSEWLL